MSKTKQKFSGGIGNLKDIVNQLDQSQNIIYESYIQFKTVNPGKSRLKMNKLIGFFETFQKTIEEIYSKFNSKSKKHSIEIYERDCKKCLPIPKNMHFNQFIEKNTSLIKYVRTMHIWFEKFNSGKINNQKYPNYIENNKFNYPFYLMLPFNVKGVDFSKTIYSKFFKPNELKQYGEVLFKTVNSIITWYEFCDIDFGEKFEKIGNVVFNISNKQEANAVIQEPLIRSTMESIFNKCYIKYIYNESIDDIYDGLIGDMAGLITNQISPSGDATEESIDASSSNKAVTLLKSAKTMIGALEQPNNKESAFLKKKIGKQFDILEGVLNDFDEDDELKEMKEILTEMKETTNVKCVEKETTNVKCVEKETDSH